MTRALCYPRDWLTIRATVLARSLFACECRGECGAVHEGGLCAAPDNALIQRAHHDLARWVRAYAIGETRQHRAPIRVSLAVSHTCQTSHCDDVSHLLALCQWCHLSLDVGQHVRNRKGAG